MIRIQKPTVLKNLRFNSVNCWEVFTKNGKVMMAFVFYAGTLDQELNELVFVDFMEGQVVSRTTLKGDSCVAILKDVKEMKCFVTSLLKGPYGETLLSLIDYSGEEIKIERSIHTEDGTFGRENFIAVYDDDKIAFAASSKDVIFFDLSLRKVLGRKGQDDEQGNIFYPSGIFYSNYNKIVIVTAWSRWADMRTIFCYSTSSFELIYRFENNYHDYGEFAFDCAGSFAFARLSTSEEDDSFFYCVALGTGDSEDKHSIEIEPMTRSA